MLAAPGQNLPPYFRVRVNGADLPDAAARDVLSVTVQEDVNAFGMFAVRLLNWDQQQLKVTWADDALFSEGSEVEVQMGYVDALAPLIVGEVTGLEAEFSATDAPTVLVRGYDRRHRLARGRRTRSFTSMKDSDIAGQIAAERGLKIQATDTGVTLDYVFQHNQTDWQFLQERAHRIGYEVSIDNKTLGFRPHAIASGARLTLARGTEILEFYPCLASLEQVSQVEVRSWSAADRATVIGHAGAADTVSMGQGTTGPAAADRAFGTTTLAIIDRALLTQSEADKVAVGQINEVALNYLTAEGTCIGRPDVRAGSVIALQGFGQRFSGEYYVWSTRHQYSPLQGYRTQFSLRRNTT